MPWLFNPFTPFGPTVETGISTAFIDEAPIDKILHHKAYDVPWLISFTLDEGLYPGADVMGDEEAIKDLDNRWEEVLPSLLDFRNTVSKNKLSLVSQKIKEHYFGAKPISSDWKQFVKMINDRMYLLGIEKSAKLHAQFYTSPVHVYQFNYIGNSHIANIFMKPSIYEGAGHGDDLGYTFKLRKFFVDEKHRPMIPFMTYIWTKFADAEPMPWGWPDVRPHLPKLTLLNINGSSPENNNFATMADLSNEQFWETLEMHENQVDGQCKNF